jgi:peptidoglycan/LPS O-acetylase OafA/YrhL
MKLCLALMTCSIGLRIVLSMILPNQVALYLIYWELPTHWDGLLLGSCLAMAMRRWPAAKLWHKVRWLVWVASTVLLGVGVYDRTFDFRLPSMEIVGFAAIPIVFAGLLLRCFVAGSWELNFFQTRFMRFMGRYSYGIYVYQVLFWPTMILELHWLANYLHSRTAGAIVYLILWFMGTLATAVLSYKFFELPFLRLKDKLAPFPDVVSRL